MTGLPHILTLVVEGGVIQEVLNLPRGVQLVVRDYDIEGADPEQLETDAEGEQYLAAIYDGDEPSPELKELYARDDQRSP